MSILIKGVKMPANCWDCPCHHCKRDDGYYDYEICRASGTIFNDGYSSATGHKTHIDPFKQRLDNCPLSPVPPHGDLIDKKTVSENLASVLNKKHPPFSYPDWNDAIVAMLTAPTIIPAEEVKES